MSDEVKNALRLARAFGGMAYEANNIANGMSDGGALQQRPGYQMGGPTPMSSQSPPQQMGSSQTDNSMISYLRPSGTMPQQMSPQTQQQPMQMPMGAPPPMAQPMPNAQPQMPMPSPMTPQQMSGAHPMAMAKGGVVEDALRIAQRPIRPIRFHHTIARHGYATDGSVEGAVTHQPDYEREDVGNILNDLGSRADVNQTVQQIQGMTPPQRMESLTTPAANATATTPQTHAQTTPAVPSPEIEDYARMGMTPPAEGETRGPMSTLRPGELTSHGSTDMRAHYQWTPKHNAVDETLEMMRKGREEGGEVKQFTDEEIHDLLHYPLGRHGYATDGAVEGDVQFLPDDSQFEKSGSVMTGEAPPEREYALPMRPYGQRFNEKTQDFNTPESKDIGFYGPVSVGEGDHVASEYSRGSDGMQYPSVAADMPENLKVQALNAARFDAPVPEEADKFARDKAAERISQGRSPFYEPGKDPFPKWSPEQHWEKPYGIDNALKLSNKVLESKPYGEFGLLPLRTDNGKVVYDPNAMSMTEFVKHAFTPKISPTEIAQGAFEMIKGIPKSIQRGAKTARRAWPVALGGEGTFDPNNPEDFAGAQDIAGLAMTGSFGGTRPAGALASGMSREQPNLNTRRLTDIGHYSPAAEAAAALKQEKGPASQMINALKNLPGVKPEELKWSGVESAFQPNEQITRQQIMDYLHENLPNIEETAYQQSAPKEGWERAIERAEARNDWDEVERLQNAWRGAGTTKYSQYTLPEGENYREVVMHLPTNWGPKIEEKYGRFGFVGPDNKFRDYWTRSEAEQAARSFKRTSGDFTSSHWNEPNVLGHLRMSDRTGPEGEKILHLEELQSDWAQEGRKKGFKSLNEESRLTPQENEEFQALNVLPDAVRTNEQESRLKELYKEIERKKSGLPAAPYITNTQHWTDLGLKRALREAAEGGYDKMIWTPGAEQAARYDLSKHIDELHWNAGNLVAYDPDGYKVIQRTGLSKEELPDLIGKEAAEKLLAQEADKSGWRYLDSEGLKVGGEGMQSFYDKIVPTQLNKLIKKLDPKAKIEMGAHKLKGKEGEEINAHVLHITPELRKRILEGLPAYAEGGTVYPKNQDALKIAHKVTGIQ